MMQLKILYEKQAQFDDKKITYRGFELTNGNLIVYGFETEYTNGDFLYRKVFKNAANSYDELTALIDLLIENTVCPDNIEETAPDLLLIKQ